MGILKDITRFTNRIRKKAYYSLNVAKITKPNANDTTPLESAIQNNDLALVRFFIDKGALLRTDDNGNTPLHRAILKNKTNIAKFLIAQGADLDKRNNFGFSPFHLMANKSYEMTQLALKKNPDIHTADTRKNTPLHNILQDKHLEDQTIKDIAKTLLAQGAKVNDKNKDGNTPLHLLLMNPNISIESKREITLMLLQKGAKADIANNQKETVLGIALNLKDEKIVLDLLENENIDETTKIAIVDTFVNSNIDITIKNANSDTLMHLLIMKSGIPEKVKLELLKAGLEPKFKEITSNKEILNIQNNQGNTVLHSAVNSNMLAIAKYLVSKGANPNIKNIDGLNPIHLAVITGSRMTELLLQEAPNNPTVDINARDSSLHTVLHWAIGNNYLNKESKKVIVKTLLNNGVDVNLENVNGHTAIHFALLNSEIDEEVRIDLIHMLKDYGAEIDIPDAQQNTILHREIQDSKLEEQERLNVINSLLRAGIDLSKLNNDNESYLHLALQHKHLQIIELLLEHNILDHIDINIQDTTEDQNTFLHRVIQKDSVDEEKKLNIIYSLLKTEIDLSKLNNNHESYLHLALQHKHLQITKLLLEHNILDHININAQNRDGNTLLHLALKNKNYRLAHILLDKGADIDVLNQRGEIPASIANQNEQSEELDSVRKRLSDLRCEKQFASFVDKWYPPTAGVNNNTSNTPTQSEVGQKPPIQPGQATTITRRPSLGRR